VKVWIVEVGAHYENSTVMGAFDRRPSVDEIMEMVESRQELTKYADWLNVYSLDVKAIKNPTRCIDKPEMLVFTRQWSDGEAVGNLGWKREA
jgi:hypothetical protein